MIQRFGAILLGIGFLLLLSAPCVFAQLPGSALSDVQQLPWGVKRVGVVETTHVEFDGLPLFEIASPFVADRALSGTEIPVEVRAKQIEVNLTALFETLRRLDNGTSPDGKTPVGNDAANTHFRMSRAE